MAIRKMTDVEMAGKRVLIREDLNVPVKDGKVTNDKRIRASMPTIQHALDAGAKVMVMSHLGRPKAGEYDEAFSLKPVAEHISTILGKPVRLEKEWIDGVDVAAGELVICENVRFFAGEKKDDEELGKKMAALCDVYVMDAFGTAHRAHSSTHAACKYAPVACAGLLLGAELDALSKAFDNPERPMVAIVGGSKVSTKLTILESLSKKVDQLIVGGGIANNFIAAAGHNVGKSLYEPELVDEAKRLMADAKAAGSEIPVPVDAVVASELSETASPTLKKITDIGPDDMILDVGPETSRLYMTYLAKAATVVWNGPVGVFEYDQFAGGTKVLGGTIADSDAFSIVGGGDTIAAVERFGIADNISYITTGGGSFLEFMEGKVLPAVAMLEQRSAE